MKIFLVAGKAGSGKNEIAKLIKEFYIYKIQKCAITSYSKYIKNFAKELSDWDGNESTKPRDFMQELGDKIRSIDPSYFTGNIIRDVAVYEQFVDALVISDVRMPKEIDDIKENFDEVYSIYVVNQFGNSTLTIAQQSHITETALENYQDFDYVIANDTLENLKEKVFNILEGLNE